jgi:hypothetical protein
MSTFQLDQCASDEVIVQACAEEGHGEAVPLPLDLHNTKDNVLVPLMMARETVFVTKDRLLARQCISLIPDRNPGIITVTNYPKRYLQMSASRVLLILRKVKQGIPAWFEVPLHNSIIEITVEGVGVAHVESGKWVTDGYFDFAVDGWQEGLLAVLRANAERFPRPLPGA